MENQFLYRNDIDVLRFLSLILVIFNHFGIVFSGGFVGVDVFFVISGYIISKINFGKMNFNRKSLKNFWLKRIRRLSPALVITLVFVSIFAFFLLLPIDFFGYAQSVAGVVCLSSNMVFWKQAGYFDSFANEKPLLHTWSLAVEEQFYIVFPLCLCLLIHKRFSILLFFGLISFFLSLVGSYIKPTPTYYFVITRGWELLIGVILGCTRQSASGKHHRILDSFKILALFLIIGSAIFLDSKAVFPGYWSLFVVIPTGLLLYFGNIPVKIGPLRSFLDSPSLGFIGKLSYPAYLVHWPLISFYWYFYDEVPGYLFKTILVLSTFLIAYGIFLIETLIRKKRILEDDWNLFCSFAVVSIFLLLFAVSGIFSKGFPSRFGNNELEKIETGSNSFLKEIGLEEHIPVDVKPKIHREGPKQKIIVWGDSHAMVLIPGLNEMLVNSDFGLVSYTRRATPPILGIADKEDRAIREDVFRYSETVLNNISSDLSISLVILGGHWTGYFDQDSLALEKGFSDVCNKLKNAGKIVILVRDVPDLCFNPVKSLRRLIIFGQKKNSFEVVSLEEIGKQKDLENRLAKFAEKSGFIIFDPVPVFSINQEFLTGESRGSYYCDQHHLGKLGSKLLAKELVKLIPANKAN